MRPCILIITLLIISATAIHAQHDTTARHMSEQHSQTSQQTRKFTDTPLNEPGNDIFGTIQEVIRKLEEDPDTNWSKVDIEALRQHLLDMKSMTENTEVVERKPLNSGLQVTLRPATSRAKTALERILDAHPAMLKKETGWTMKVSKKDQNYRIKVTTNNPDEVSKIQGLGYIGVMAYGSHHKKHHWMIATDKNPHMNH